MNYTSVDLATRALRKASLIGAEEVPSAADLAFAQEGIASDTAALAIEGIVIENGDDNDVPLEHLEPRADYHAVTLRADFGLIPETEAEQTRAMKRPRLYRLCAKPPSDEPVHGEYF